MRKTIKCLNSQTIPHQVLEIKQNYNLQNKTREIERKRKEGLLESPWEFGGFFSLSINVCQWENVSRMNEISLLFKFREFNAKLVATC